MTAAGSGRGDYPGEPWTVPKFYWTVLARSAFEAAYDGLDGDDVLSEWTVPRLQDIPFGFADEDIDAVVETGPDAYAAKVAALAAQFTPPEARATGIAATQTVVAIGRFVSASAFGLLWYAIGSAAAMLVAAGLLTVAIPLVALLLRPYLSAPGGRAAPPAPRPEGSEGAR